MTAEASRPAPQTRAGAVTSVAERLAEAGLSPHGARRPSPGCCYRSARLATGEEDAQ